MTESLRPDLGDGRGAEPRPGLLRPALVAGALTFAAAGLGGALTEIGPWYRALAQPSWSPADWVFPAVWTPVFILIASAAALAWRGAAGRPGLRGAIVALYLFNGALNVLWSALFFAARRPDWALIEVAGLWLSIVALIVVSARASRVAPWLLAPYLIWVSIAAALNYEVVRLNPPFGG